MMLALVVTALLGQTVYEWTDASGETHYTDDPSSVPKGVKARTTGGDDISVVGRASAGKQRPADGGVPPAKATAAPKPERDRCAEAKQKLEAAEERLAAAKKEHELRVARAAGDCQQVLRTHGQAEYAKCTRGRRRPESVPEPSFGTLEQQVEAAREALRRAQVAGCVE